MQILRILHPPAAANPLLVMLEGGVPLDFLLAPVLIGSGALSLVAALYNKLVTKHRYFRVVLHYVANISEDAGRDRLFKSR